MEKREWCNVERFSICVYGHVLCTCCWCIFWAKKHGAWYVWNQNVSCSVQHCIRTRSVHKTRDVVCVLYFCYGVCALLRIAAYGISIGRFMIELIRRVNFYENILKITFTWMQNSLFSNQISTQVRIYWTVLIENTLAISSYFDIFESEYKKEISRTFKHWSLHVCSFGAYILCCFHSCFCWCEWA